MRGVLLLILAFAAGVACAGDIQYRVQIDGLGSDRVKQLRSQLEIEAWHDSPEMNLEQLQRLHALTPDRLRELLATLGFFNAKVEATLEQDGEEWVARYQVDAGQQARVGHVNLQFAGALARSDADPDAAERRERLLNRWPLKQGTAFSQDKWRSSKEQLLENLTSDNYPYAHMVTTQAVVADDGTRVDLDVTINSGPRVRFGQLRVSGLATYPASTVANLNTIDPGTDFSREALLDYQSRLIQSGYFAGVLVDIQKPASDTVLDEALTETADVVVQVTELKQQQVRLGVGYSSNSGERGQIGYENRNIFGRGWRWNVLIKADRLAQSLSTEIAFPAGSDLYQDSIGYSVEHNSIGLIDTYDDRIYGKRQWGNTRFERTLSIELLDEYIVNPLKSPSRSETVTTSMGYSWIKRDVNDLVFPTRGLIRDYEGLIGTQLRLNPYLRLYGRWNLYRPLGRRWLFLGRVEAGQIIGTLGDVPTDYRFLSGGDNALRGYLYRSIGDPDQTRDPGAKTMGVTSTEIQYWFTSKWGAAAFFDAGSLGSQFLRTRWYQGYGGGLRWRSPVGPLNLDYAWGRRQHDYQIHFSIGLAF